MHIVKIEINNIFDSSCAPSKLQSLPSQNQYKHLYASESTMRMIKNKNTGTKQKDPAAVKEEETIKHQYCQPV